MDHVVTIQNLANDDIVSVLDRARELLPVAHGDKHSDALAGKILATCFFEPSTRTRLSFETAMHRLGGNVIGFADSSATSHLKGETLADAVQMVAGYADAIVLRHPQEGAAQLAAEISKVPVINGGDGAGPPDGAQQQPLGARGDEAPPVEGQRGRAGARDAVPIPAARRISFS